MEIVDFLNKRVEAIEIQIENLGGRLDKLNSLKPKLEDDNYFNEFFEIYELRNALFVQRRTYTDLIKDLSSENG